jgi:basic membrane protein A and related proteins
MMTRRVRIVLVAVLVIAAVVSGAAFGQAKKALKVAFLFPGLINEGSFNKMAWAALEQAKKDLKAETAYVEGVDVPDAAKYLRDYASKGYDAIVAWSGAFPGAVIQVAPDFPKVSFITLADPGDFPKNVWLVGTDFEDVYYLTGAAAGLITKSNKIGHVLAIPIPVYAAGAKAFAAGAKAANPKAEVFETFIGDFNDVVKATQTATAQVESGADVLMASLDLAELGVINVAKANPGTRVFAMMSDVPSKESVYVGSILQDYPTALNTIFKQVAAGKIGGFQTMGLKGKLGRLSDLKGRGVPADVMAKLADIQKQLEAGKIKYPTPADLTQ